MGRIWRVLAAAAISAIATALILDAAPDESQLAPAPPERPVPQALTNYPSVTRPGKVTLPIPTELALK